MFSRYASILFCIGFLFYASCAYEKTQSSYSERNDRVSYYTCLYTDSTFLECEGNLEYPWVMDRQLGVYMAAHKRMTRHLRFDDTLIWNFSSNDVKVSENIYEYITGCWQYDNELLKSGKFTLRLLPYGYAMIKICQQ